MRVTNIVSLDGPSVGPSVPECEKSSRLGQNLFHGVQSRTLVEKDDGHQPQRRAH